MDIDIQEEQVETIPLRQQLFELVLRAEGHNPQFMDAVDDVLDFDVVYAEIERILLSAGLPLDTECEKDFINLKKYTYEQLVDHWRVDSEWEGRFSDFICALVHTAFVKNPGAVNYLEFKVQHYLTNDFYTVLIQKQQGKTPADLNAEIRAENERLQADVDALRDELDNVRARYVGLLAEAVYGDNE